MVLENKIDYRELFYEETGGSTYINENPTWEYVEWLEKKLGHVESDVLTIFKSIIDGSE